MKVWQHWTTYTIVEIMDSTLIGNAPEDQVLKCVHIGLLCVQENPVDRPMMSTINVMLSSSSSAASLRAPQRPVFFPTGSQFTRSGTMSLNEVSVTELEPR
jgi:hypothetical protein